MKLDKSMNGRRKTLIEGDLNRILRFGMGFRPDGHDGQVDIILSFGWDGQCLELILKEHEVPKVIDRLKEWLAKGHDHRVEFLKERHD